MTELAVRIDTTSQVPPYEQIRTQLAALILTSQLAEGERLPTVRQLATDLGRPRGSTGQGVGDAGRERARSEWIGAGFLPLFRPETSTAW
jgi:GntR family transcriptional regulator